MQNNHKPQHIYTEKVFKIISSLFLSNLNLQFSGRHNSLYGYSDFLARLFDMCRHGQYAETAYNSRFIKGAKNQCKRIPCGTWMLDVIKQVRYNYADPLPWDGWLYSNDDDDEKARHAQDAWTWQSASTPFQDTTRYTTCSTSLPQSSRTEHATLTVLPPSTAP